MTYLYVLYQLVMRKGRTLRLHRREDLPAVDDSPSLGATQDDAGALHPGARTDRRELERRESD